MGYSTSAIRRYKGRNREMWGGPERLLTCVCALLNRLGPDTAVDLNVLVRESCAKLRDLRNAALDELLTAPPYMRSCEHARNQLWRQAQPGRTWVYCHDKNHVDKRANLVGDSSRWGIG